VRRTSQKPTNGSSAGAGASPGPAGPSIPSGPTPGNRRGTGGTLPPVETQFRPGISGNLSGRPKGDGKMRRLMAESLNLSREEALEALGRRWRSTRHVQDMVELYAKLEGELTKVAGEDARGVQVIFLNNRGRSKLDPEIFREAARLKALEQHDGLVDEDG
jgi:hypothetical protein